MGILDRWLFREFFLSLITSLLILFGIYVTFDLLSRIDAFSTVAAQRGQWIGRTLFDYYTPQLFRFFDMTGAGLTLMAAILAVSSLRKHNQQTALTAAGIAPSRCFRAVFIAVVLVGIPAILNREMVLPQFQTDLMQDITEIQSNAFARRAISATDYARVQFNAKGCDPEKKEIFDLSLELPKRCLPGGGNLVHAKVALFEPATPGLPAGFRLREIVQPHGLTEGPAIQLGDRPVILTCADFPEQLAPNECFLVTNLIFEQILDQNTWSATTDTRTLLRSIHAAPEDFGPVGRTSFHIRILRPVSDLAVVLIGLPLIIRRRDANVFRPILISLVVTGLCFVLNRGCQWAGNSMWLTPELAAWLPVLVMLPLTTILCCRMDA